MKKISRNVIIPVGIEYKEHKLLIAKRSPSFFKDLCREVNERAVRKFLENYTDVSYISEEYITRTIDSYKNFQEVLIEWGYMDEPYAEDASVEAVILESGLYAIYLTYDDSIEKPKTHEIKVLSDLTYKQGMDALALISTDSEISGLMYKELDADEMYIITDIYFKENPNGFPKNPLKDLYITVEIKNVIDESLSEIYKFKMATNISVDHYNNMSKLLKVGDVIDGRDYDDLGGCKYKLTDWGFIINSADVEGLSYGDLIGRVKILKGE